MRAVPIEIDWHPGLSIYASEPFLRTVGDEYGWLGGVDAAGTFRCLLPFTIVRKPLFSLVRFRVETIPIGSGLTISEEKSFLNNVVSYFRSRNADMIIPATTNTIFRVYPDGAVAAPYGTYIMDLTQPKEILWDNLSSSHRRKIRLAIKAEVKIKNGAEYLRRVYELVRDTFKRSGLGFMNYVSFEQQMFGLGDNVKMLVAEYQGIIQGGMVIPFSDRSAYYLYGGSIPQPAPGAMNLLHWSAIQLFRELGVKTYDFVGVRINPVKGSKQDGLRIFKERFGGKLLQGYMWKYSLHPLKYFAYNIAVRLLRKGDIVDQERHKVSVSQAGEATCVRGGTVTAPQSPTAGE